MNHLAKIWNKHAGAVALAALAASAPLAVPAAVAQPPERASASAHSGSTQPGSAQLSQVATALRAIRTMQADFLQTDRNGQSVRGIMTLKQPGRIRFEYEKSVPMLVVGDGSSLTVVDYGVRQVQRWPIKDSPLGALLDPSRDVSRYGTLRPTGNRDVVSVEVRDKAHPEYGVITLIFIRKPSAPGGFELVRWVALDSQNKQTMIQLSNQRYGLAVPDSTFRWRDPRPRIRR